MQINFDVDIDMANRDLLLEKIKHIPASMRNINPIRKHATGVYPVDIPYDPVYDMAAIDYDEAERRGYFKLDLLNVYVYEQVKSEEHLIELLTEPDWTMLEDKAIVEQLIHLNGHFNVIQRMPEPINSITRLAMFLAIIRPSKRHLIGQTWSEVSKTIWDADGTGYTFKKSHSIAYAHLVVINMNLIRENNAAKVS